MGGYPFYINDMAWNKLKNWRIIATIYDKSGQSFLNSVTIAVLFSYYLI
jgi:hypothetical protein